MSQSHRPTCASGGRSATARLAATVDLPTPPLPLAAAVSLSILIVQLIANLIVASGGSPGRLLTSLGNEVRFLPIRPGVVFRFHWIGGQVEPEDSVFVVRKFQHEETSRRAIINFDIAHAHTGVRNCIPPISRHYVPIGIELRLNAGETLD